MRALHSTQLLATVTFLASIVVLTGQLVNPSPIMVSVSESSAEVTEIGTYFGYFEVGIITIAATFLGASATYLLVGDEAETANEAIPAATASEQSDTPEPSDELLEARREEWEETVERLANNERKIYETILEADGVIAQSEIVNGTDLSKATVSRSLDNLETKNLVERKRRGMGNMVLLL